MIYGIRKMTAINKRIVVVMIAAMGCMMCYWAVAAPADYEDQLLGSGSTVDLMDPFDLTVTQYVVSPAGGLQPVTLDMDKTVSIVAPPMPTTHFLRPLVRIPYKPPFRSPCQP